MPTHEPSATPPEGLKGPMIHDTLTGVYSIEYFEHQVRSQVAYSLRHERPLSMFLVAVDYLDELTRSFGAGARDAIFVRVAERLRENIREEDVLARYGTDEFALLCLDTPKEAATFLATRMRQSVESAGLTHAGMELPVTVSVGVATLDPSDEEHHAMVESAEGALARARGTGNCVVVADEG